MEINEKFDKLQKLTFETEMLINIMHEVLISNEENLEISSICYLSEIICQKVKEIRALF